MTESFYGEGDVNQGAETLLDAVQEMGPSYMDELVDWMIDRLAAIGIEVQKGGAQ